MKVSGQEGRTAHRLLNRDDLFLSELRVSIPRADGPIRRMARSLCGWKIVLFHQSSDHVPASLPRTNPNSDDCPSSLLQINIFSQVSKSDSRERAVPGTVEFDRELRGQVSDINVPAVDRQVGDYWDAAFLETFEEGRLDSGERRSLTRPRDVLVPSFCAFCQRPHLEADNSEALLHGGGRASKPPADFGRAETLLVKLDHAVRGDGQFHVPMVGALL